MLCSIELHLVSLALSSRDTHPQARRCFVTPGLQKRKAVDISSGVSAIVGIILYYLPPLLLSFLLCQPLCHSRYLSISEQLKNSPRPFYSASNYYLEKAFFSDSTAQKALANVRNAIKDCDYKSGKQAFSEIAPHYSSLPIVKDMETKLEEIRLQREKHYTGKPVVW